MLKRINRLDWGIILALLLPLIVALPTWGDGIAAGADVEVHVHRIHAMTLALQDGNLYPRWISYLHLGYGYPIFNFYAPGYAYFTALFELIGFHITTAYNLVQTLAWSVGSVGMYLLARRFVSTPAAILAAALWTFAPSRLYEVWWQGSLAQIMSAAFIPYLMLGVIKNSKKPTLHGILGIALPYAALMMTHTPMMYISTLYAAPLAFLAPIAYAKLDMKALFWRWLYIGGGFVLGVGLASIFLIPTLLELQYIQISQGLDETVNYLIEQYLPVSDIFTLPRLIDRTDRFLDFPITLGLVGGILSLFGIAGFLRRKQYGVLLMSMLGLGFTIFMLLDISLDVWLTIPAFANLRFPARLLRIGAVLIGLLGGASLLLLPKKWHVVGMVGGIVLVVAQILPISQPYDAWLNWDNISAYDEILHEQTDRTWGTVSYDEFNPIWGDRIFLDVPPNPERYIDEPFHLRVFGRDIAAVNWEGFSEESIADNIIRVSTDIERAVRFRQYYFPGWQATVDGIKVDIYPDDEIGLITIDLPAGEYLVELNYVGTPIQLTASVITWLSILICFGLYYFGRHQIDDTNNDDDSPISTRTGIILAVLIIGFAVINDRVIQSNHWFKYQSPATEPRYMETQLNSQLTDDIMLLGYTLNDSSISQSDPLDIDLYWHTTSTTTQNYRPLVQLVSLSQDAAWATSSNLQPAAGEFSTLTPDRFARDPYRLRLFETDIPPYVGRIMIQLLDENGTVTLTDGTDRILLDPIITVDTSDDRIVATWDRPYQFGAEFASLLCATIERTETNYDITLGWQLDNAPREELVVMVQGLNAEGALVTSGDAPPFNNNYPAWHWRTGQTLLDTHQLTFDESVTTIAIGLYDRATVTRLPIIQNGESLPNNQILLALEEQSCSQ